MRWWPRRTGPARPCGPCRCPRNCARAWTRPSRTWPTWPRTATAGCWSRGCSCGSSCPRGRAGLTSTSPARRSMTGRRTGIPRRAGRARRPGPSCRSRWTPRREGSSRPRVLLTAGDDRLIGARSTSVADSNGSYDIVILGGGSGGYACALRAAELGKRVALIEKDKVGGTCLHRGCIPTKALLHAAEVADSSRDSEKFGIRTSFEGIDMPAVLSYQESVVDRLWKGLQSTIASRKIDTIIGDGRLLSPTSVSVGDAVYTGDHIVLATGSVPKSLPGLTIDGDRIISSDDALRLDRVPKSAIILGGGVIGVEFASVWRSFGADVMIVEMLPQLLPLEDEASAKVLQRAFRRRGIGFQLGERFQSVSYTDDGVTVTLENGKSASAEGLLVAVGRGPVSADP